MKTDETTRKKAVEGHDYRNEELRVVFLRDGVSLTDSREIDCHFWMPDETAGRQLAASLVSEGFQLKVSRQGTSGGRLNWNLELTVRQSIALTLRHEFTETLVNAADRFGGRYDGWGTSL
jgi:hypothetical protein